jgi:hypothetical protein
MELNSRLRCDSIADREDLLQEVKRRFIAKIESLNVGSVNEQCRDLNSDSDCMDEVVASSPLGSKEALGETERKDFPLLRGKEVLMQAVYRGYAGQAFTTASGSFQGCLGDVLKWPLQSTFERAVFIATMNAVLRSLDLIEGTVHCKNDGPGECASHLGQWLAEQGADKVGLIGMQPALLEALVKTLGPEKVMVADLAEAGTVHCGVKVLDGLEASRIFEECQIILITGSTLVNGTIDGLMENALSHKRRVVFFGTTMSGAAYLLGLERFCPCST